MFSEDSRCLHNPGTGGGTVRGDDWPGSTGSLHKGGPCVNKIGNKIEIALFVVLVVLALGAACWWKPAADPGDSIAEPSPTETPTGKGLSRVRTLL